MAAGGSTVLEKGDTRGIGTGDDGDNDNGNDNKKKV